MNISKKNQTLIFLFIQKISPTNMQDLIFFFKNKNFNLKRITKNSNKQIFSAKILNSNFVLESDNRISKDNFLKLVAFLNQHTQINIILFENQLLNMKRTVNLKQQSELNLWQKINFLML